MTASPLLLPVRGVTPVVEPGAWLAPGVVLAGRVTVRAGASVWFGAVLRAEDGAIEVGPDANIQDGCVLHADHDLTLRVGRNTSVGHGAVLHGCVIGDDVVVGMGCRVLNRATIGSESLVAAGAVVLEGTEAAPRSLLAGVPAKVRRELGDEELESGRENGRIYQRLRDEYAAALADGATS